VNEKKGLGKDLLVRKIEGVRNIERRIKKV
jgi:hypothetical protein